MRASWRRVGCSNPSQTPKPVLACRPSVRRCRLIHCQSAALEEVQEAPSERRRDREPPNDDDLVFDVPEAVLQRNKELADKLKGKLILAPLTKGGNLPFRRLCASFGAEVTMSEMSFSKTLLKGDVVERARLVKSSDEHCFGFQIATKVISEGVQASKMAREAGSSWIDLNVGCPIYEASRRGLGAIMMRKPRSLAKLVHGIVMESELPVTVKLRTGESDRKVNIDRIATLLARTGAAAITVHGRTMEQRYRKPADWSIVKSIVDTHPGLPVIGNGDVLTHYEVSRRFQEGGVHAIMSGRGALIKPWFFQEVKEGRELNLTASDRVGVYRQLVSYMKEHFGDDDKGRRKAWYFLPFHFQFFHRYRRYPEEVYGDASREHPLLLTRFDLADPKLGEVLDSLDPLERILRCEHSPAYDEIAGVLWDSPSDAEAKAGLERLAAEKLPGWEAEARSAGPLEPGRGGGLAGGKRTRQEEEY